MSKRFSQFPGGNPPLDTDRFLIGRVDAGSPSGFSNYIMTWAEIKTALPAGNASDPFEGSYAPGSFDIVDGDYVVMGSRLILNGIESVTLNGNAVLIIVG